MGKPLNGPAMCKKGPWKGALCAVSSANMGDGFDVPVWVLVHPAGTVAVIRMNQGKAADEERSRYWEVREAADNEVALEIASTLIRDLTQYERENDPDYKRSGKECECKECKALIYSHQKAEHIKYQHSALLQERVKAQDAVQEQKQAA